MVLITSYSQIKYQAIRFLSCLVFLGQVLLSSATFAQTELKEIQYWYRNYDSNSSLTMLKLALNKTEDLYGPTKISRSNEFTQGRAALLLEHNQNNLLDVVEFVPESKRLKDLMPIYVALEEGLIGYRVCLIRQTDADKFKGIRSIKDFNSRGLKIGQGTHWPDVRILEANDFTVDTTVEYETLYNMLSVGRFDCFLRGAHEVLEDFNKHRNLGLIIEPSLVFVYPSVSLFFVSKENKDLAMRVELGLRRALLDREFEKTFEKLYADTLDKLNMSARRIIYLNNPFLDDEVFSKSSRHGLIIDGKISN